MKLFKHTILISALLLFLVGIGHAYYFKKTDSTYERTVRTTIARVVTTLSNYGNKYAVEQSVGVDEPLIAFSDKLVYSQSEKIIVSYRSDQPVELSVYHFTNEDKQLITKQKASITIRSGTVTLDTFKGYHRDDFDRTSFDLPPKSGWYQIEVSSNSHIRNIPVFVGGDNTSDVLFVESTDTMKAYKAANNQRTNYQNLQGLLGVFTRPIAYPMDYKLEHYKNTDGMGNIDCADHLANADFVIKKTLDELDIKYDVTSDAYLNSAGNLSQYRVIVFGAHNEYWTTTKIKLIQQYLNNGGNLMLLGGNTAWRFVAQNNEYDLIWGDSVYGTPHVQFITEFLGAYYDSRGYTTTAPYKVTSDGVKSELVKNLNEGELFGVGSDFKDCAKKAKGASGYETDKLLNESLGFTVIATGQNPGGGGADIVYKQLSSGGHVLNFGSVALWHRMEDPVVRNLISTFIKLANSKQGFRDSVRE